MDVHKITLPSGKVVLVREIELADEEQAAKSVKGQSEVGVGLGLLTELTRLLVVEVSGQKVGPTDRLQLGNPKSLLPYKEFVMVRRVVEKLMGEAGAEPAIEFGVSGQP